MILLWLAALVIPLGLDLYMPVPEENPLTVEKVDLGRRLFNDRGLSRDGSIALTIFETTHTHHRPAHGARQTTGSTRKS